MDPTDYIFDELGGRSPVVLTGDIRVQFDRHGNLWIVQRGEPLRHVFLSSLAALRLFMLMQQQKQAMIDTVIETWGLFA